MGASMTALLIMTHLPVSQVKGKKAAAVPEELIAKWTKADVRAIEDRLLALGPHRTADVRQQASSLLSVPLVQWAPACLFVSVCRYIPFRCSCASCRV